MVDDDEKKSEPSIYMIHPSLRLAGIHPKFKISRCTTICLAKLKTNTFAARHILLLSQFSIFKTRPPCYSMHPLLLLTPWNASAPFLLSPRRSAGMRDFARALAVMHCYVVRASPSSRSFLYLSLRGCKCGWTRTSVHAYERACVRASVYLCARSPVSSERPMARLWRRTLV